MLFRLKVPFGWHGVCCVCLTLIFGAKMSLVILADDGKPAAAPPKSTPAAREASKDALARFNGLIGGWRGVGMPKRASRQGAWQENAEWSWNFKNDGVALTYAIKGGQLLTAARLDYNPEEKEYRLTATFADKSTRQYTGKFDDDASRLVLESVPDADDDVYRMTIRQLNEKRTVVLHEKRGVQQTFYARVAEIGYTRKGTRLASSSQTGPECIVTGGAGTMQVSHQGKTYYVCCTGCRDAFNDDPEAIIADAQERLTEKRAAQKEK